jgi:hypothetical protein
MLGIVAIPKEAGFAFGKGGDEARLAQEKRSYEEGKGRILVFDLAPIQERPDPYIHPITLSRQKNT